MNVTSNGLTTNWPDDFPYCHVYPQQLSEYVGKFHLSKELDSFLALKDSVRKRDVWGAKTVSYTNKELITLTR